MECDDLVEDCIQTETQCNFHYDECHRLYEGGILYAAHQLMLKNIDGCVDLGSKQSELYDCIKREHTLIFGKIQLLRSAEKWKKSSVSDKGKGIDDTVQIRASPDDATTFLVEAKLDAGAVQCIALASRLEFVDAWIKAISSSTFVRKLSGHSHVARVTVKNPILRMFGDNVLYVRVDTYNNLLFDQHHITVVSPLSVEDARKHNIAGEKYQACSRYFSFSALTFLFSSETGQTLQRSNANVKIYIEHMQILRYTPAYLNSIMCVDFIGRMCRHWATTARQLGDMLYEGERLADLVAFIDNSPLMTD